MDESEVLKYVGEITKFTLHINDYIKLGKIYQIPDAGLVKNDDYFFVVSKVMYGYDGFIYHASSFKEIVKKNPGDTVYTNSGGVLVPYTAGPHSDFDSYLQRHDSDKDSDIKAYVKTCCQVESLQAILDATGVYSVGEGKTKMSGDGLEIDAETGELKNPTGRFRFF